ncbi:hypothetical protein [Micromonospora sp. IBHARD004]|uniref:hypothetical protein n=1 Tax=Micromonospora sp. IBHARD004 TaxID=3457764 RepID=UPI0040594F03
MRRRQGDLGLLTLAGAPFLLLAMQSYGGEILLRVYAFALPFMAILLAALLVPVWPARRRVLAALTAGSLSTVLIGAFFGARYGNEAFEQVRPADHRAVEWLYAHAPAGGLVRLGDLQRPLAGAGHRTVPVPTHRRGPRADHDPRH